MASSGTLAQDFPRGTVRCRVRATGVVVELDPETLAALDGARRDAVREDVERRFGGLLPHYGLSFAAYRNGSAFLHGPA